MGSKSGSLTLTSDYFKIVIELVLDTFLSKHKLKKLPKAFQLYGYGSFEEHKPSLKTDFEAIGSEFINGKYLYDKFREYEKGKSLIKLNEYYKTIILLYLGFDDIQKLLDAHEVSEPEKDKQQALIYGDKSESTVYFLNYYFGEDDVIIKGKTIISNNWKKIQHVFMYPHEDGSIREHYSHGTVTHQGDTVYIRTKTLSGGRYIDGASEIYYIGHKSLTDMNFLVGTYCTFDIYTNTVAGRAILERCDTKERMDVEAQSKFIPPYIAMEVRDKRIVNSKNTVAKNFLELSDNSPYASIYGKIPGRYTFNFNVEDSFNDTLEIKILDTNFKIETLTENVHVEKDRIELINKGSILNLRFSFTGIIIMERVCIYIKTYFLKGGEASQTGVFSGVDNENRLISGDVSMDFKPFH